MTLPLPRERIRAAYHKAMALKQGPTDRSQAPGGALRGKAEGIEVRRPDLGEDAYRAYLPARYAR
jgi:hypothetical protein